MADIRRFEKTDWYAWAGAEKFNNGSQSFIYEQNLDEGKSAVTVIGDRRGIEITIFAEDDQDPEDLSWFLFSENMNPTRVEGEMKAIAQALQGFGNAPDLCYALDHKKTPFEYFESV